MEDASADERHQVPRRAERHLRRRRLRAGARLRRDPPRRRRLGRSVLPETPLLGVLPGTGGLTRVVDKRKVRRDLADVLQHAGRRRERQARGGVAAASTPCLPTSQFKDAVATRAAGAGRARRIARQRARASRWGRSSPTIDGDAITYRYVHGRDRPRQARRRAHDRGARHAAAGDAGRDPGRGRSGLGAARVPRAGRRAPAAAVQRAGDRHDRPRTTGDPAGGARRRRARSPRTATTGWCARSSPHQAHAEAARPDRAQPSSRSSSRARASPARCSSWRSPPTALHARRPRRAERRSSCRR